MGEQRKSISKNTKQSKEMVRTVKRLPLMSGVELESRTHKAGSVFLKIACVFNSSASVRRWERDTG